MMNEGELKTVAEMVAEPALLRVRALQVLTTDLNPDWQLAALSAAMKSLLSSDIHPTKVSGHQLPPELSMVEWDRDVLKVYANPGRFKNVLVMFQYKQLQHGMGLAMAHSGAVVGEFHMKVGFSGARSEHGEHTVELLGVVHTPTGFYRFHLGADNMEELIAPDLRKLFWHPLEEPLRPQEVKYISVDLTADSGAGF